MKGAAGMQIHRAPDNLPGCWSKLLQKLALFVSMFTWPT